VRVWRRATRALAAAASIALIGAGASCNRQRPPARRALDCKQVDGWLRPFHREFLIDVPARRAWGDQAKNGNFEIDVEFSSSIRVRGESRAKCPPNDPETCEVLRVVRYDFDLAGHKMVETMRNDVDGKIVETSHYDCDDVPLDRSVVARRLADPPGQN
jgi:hypothetical protein